MVVGWLAGLGVYDLPIPASSMCQELLNVQPSLMVWKPRTIAPVGSPRGIFFTAGGGLSTGVTDLTATLPCRPPLPWPLPLAPLLLVAFLTWRPGAGGDARLISKHRSAQSKASCKLPSEPRIDGVVHSAHIFGFIREISVRMFSMLSTRVLSRSKISKANKSGDLCTALLQCTTSVVGRLFHQIGNRLINPSSPGRVLRSCSSQVRTRPS